MAMVMMTQVVRRRPRLVLAIGAHRGPTQLERQKYHEEDREPAAHAAHYSGKRDENENGDWTAEASHRDRAGPCDVMC